MSISRFRFTNEERDWFNSMLRARGLERRIGEHIYKYRITSSEYQQLKKLLTNRCKTECIAEILNQTGFQTLFIAYAAEWWKREYTGGTWNWDAIFNSLGTERPNYWGNRTREIITRGLSNWGLTVSDGGHTYFGAIVANGGLPARYLQDPNNSSNLRTLIHACLSYKIKYVVSPMALRQYLISHTSTSALPACMQCDEIYDLILSIVQTIVSLKEQYNLHEKSNAIDRLDRANPNWRDALPILLEDASVKQLFDGLLTDATEIQYQGKKPRGIRIIQNNELVPSFIFPEHAESEYFIHFEPNDPENLPSKFDIITWDDNPICVASVRRNIIRPNEFEIIQNTPNIDVTQSIALQLYSPDRGTFSPPMRVADSLDTTQPMVFIKDSNSNHIFFTSGTTYLSQSECAIAVSESDTLNTTLASSEKIGEFQISDTTFNLYKCTSDIDLGEYEIKLNVKNPSQQYTLGGNLFPYKTRPYEAYRTTPTLYSIDTENNLIEIHNLTFMRHNSDTILNKDERYGLVDVCYIKEGKTLCRLPAFILPSDARIKFHAGQSITSGKITFENFDDFEILPRASDLYTTQMFGTDTAILTATNATPPASTSFRIQDDTGHINFSLPFPVSGAAFYSDSNECINSHLISLGHIYGKRINIFNFTSKITSCTITLSAQKKKIKREINIQNEFTKISLSDFESDIRFLFATNNEPVRVSVDIGGTTPSISIFKYDATLITSPDNNMMLQINTETNVSNQTRINSVCISNPDTTAIEIPVSSEGILDLSTLNATPGTHVIFSPQTSNISIAPMVRHIKSSDTAIPPLYEYISSASGLTDFLRDNMCNNFKSDIWSQISHIADTFIKYNIPFSDFRLWRNIAREPDLLCAFLLRIKSLELTFPNTLNIQQRFEYAHQLLSIHRHSDKENLLHKFRNQMTTYVPLITYQTLKDATQHYKDYLYSNLHRDFTDFIHQTYPAQFWNYMEHEYGPELESVFIHILGLCYNAISNVFSEIQYTLATSLFNEIQAGEFIIQHNQNPIFSLLNANIAARAKPAQSKKEYLEKILNDAKTLPVLLGRDGTYQDISISSHNLLEKLSPQCYQSCPESAFSDFIQLYNGINRRQPGNSLSRYKETKEKIKNADIAALQRHNVMFFPIFCAILSYCSKDNESLNSTEYKNAINSFMNFNRNYFVETYKNATIILSKTE